MYRKYWHDLFTEGLGDIFFMKFYHFLKKKVRNKTLYQILLGIHVFIYIIFLIIVALVIFKFSFPI